MGGKNLFSVQVNTIIITQNSFCTRRLEGSQCHANFYKWLQKGSRELRPVSLTSVFGKLLENIIKNRIVSHMDGQVLLGNSQHGSCKGSLRISSLLEFFEDANMHVTEDVQVDRVYMKKVSFL